MNTSFQPSDKVICVDDDWSKCWANPLDHFPKLPIAGQTYAVKEMGVANNGETMVLLVGLESFNKQGGFYPRRFRLLSEVKKEAHASTSILETK
jgi:hypothetical protein